MVAPELAIFDNEWKNGDRGLAKSLAVSYSNRNRRKLEALFAGKGIPELVKMVDSLREQGKEEERIEVDAWLLARFEPQHITGEIKLGA